MPRLSDMRIPPYAYLVLPEGRLEPIMTKDVTQTFEEWQESSFSGGLGGGKSIAKLAWHARDAEVSKLESEKTELLAALKLLHDETKEYIEINHLGNPYHNISMRLARAAIQHAEEPCCSK